MAFIRNIRYNKNMKIDIKNIQPEGRRVIVEVPADEKTESGLELSTTAGSVTPIMGTVIAKGIISEYAIGTVIFFRKYSVDELAVKSEGEEKKIYLVEDIEVVATYKLPVEEVVDQRKVKLEANKLNQDAVKPS